MRSIDSYGATQYNLKGDLVMTKALTGTMREYQEMVGGKMKVHKPLTAEQARLLDWTVGLAGEAGEVSELIKHAVFHGEEIDKMEAAKEIGDVIWYCTALCETLGFTLEDALLLNYAKLTHRHNGKGFNKEASAERHDREKKFSDTFEYKTLEARIGGKVHV